MKKLILLFTILSLASTGCMTTRTVVSPTGETVGDVKSAVRVLAQAKVGRELSDDELEQLVYLLENSEEVQFALEKLKTGSAEKPVDLVAEASKAKEEMQDEVVSQIKEEVETRIQQEVKKVEKQIEEKMQEVEKIEEMIETMQQTVTPPAQLVIKYCPKDGQRFPARAEICPTHGVELLIVE